MKITIDEAICLKHKITLAEAMIALVIKDTDAYEEIPNMIKRKILEKDSTEDWYKVTPIWSKILDNIIQESSDDTDTDEALLELADKIRQCFPEGKMKDRYGRLTPYYYRCNRTEIKSSLKRFFKHTHTRPSDEEIINATKRYVASFNGDYDGRLRLAKYFIWKNDIIPTANGNSEVEQKSDLETYLNSQEDNEDINDEREWTTKVI